MPRPFAPVLFAATLMLSACGAGDTPGEPGETSPETSQVQPEAVADAGPAASREPAATASQTPDAEDRCGASEVRDRWLNALPSAEVKAAIADAVGERTIRYYTDGDPVTMDFSEDRLNVVLGTDGRIKEFTCG